MKQVEINMIKSMTNKEIERAINANESISRQYKVQGFERLYAKRIDKIEYLKNVLKERKL